MAEFVRFAILLGCKSLQMRGWRSEVSTRQSND
jgi:hypothetical protein